MISRTWRGWTTHGNADKYEELFRTTIFPGILVRDIPGFDAIELGRRALGEEVEFLTTMWFQSWDAVKQFAGPDWEISVVPPAARTLLTRFDEKAQHYEIQERRSAAAVRPTALDTTIKLSMGMEPRLSIVTLGVTDVACASAFYEGLGWPRKVRGAVGVAFFQLNGIGLSLYPRAALAADAGVPLQTAPSQGLTLAYNTRSRDEVDAVLARAGALGGRITCSAQDAVWGGYHGHFADPEGFLWEIAWNPGFTLTADGVLSLPE